MKAEAIAKKIKLVCLDVDGVLIYFSDGDLGYLNYCLF